MSFIRTVLSDIAPEQLGVCYAHEHIIIESCFATFENPDFLLDDVEKAVAELKELKALGVDACVDSWPSSRGRNVEKLAEVSRQSGVHIIAPTGLHLAKYYDYDDARQYLGQDIWQSSFSADIDQGIPFREHVAPFKRVGKVPIGLIKIAALEQWDEQTKVIFRSAAKSHAETGCPILTHTENGELALEQALFLQQQGADLNHVVLSHLDRKADANYHREVLKTGVTIEYDSHFRWKNRQPNPTLELIKELLPEFPNQIVLGMDAARRSYWKSYGGGPGLSYLYGDFRYQMSDVGISDELIHQVFVSTPARVYSFKN